MEYEDMPGASFIVPPLSRENIRGIARDIRRIAQELEERKADAPFFDITRFLDIALPQALPNFALEIVSENDMRSVHGGAHAMTFPDDLIIQIREDIWHGAQQGCGRDRFTAAHELGHLIIHRNVGFARRMANKATKPYCTSEWQADAFAGELLVYFDFLHQCQSPKEAQTLFGVSPDAARVQWKCRKAAKKRNRSRGATS